MLLTPAESLIVALCPDSVGVVSTRSRAGQKSECIKAENEDGPVWRGAVESLSRWLAGNGLGRGRTSIVLSSRFVRYALVPWPPSALKRDEAAVWARVHLEAAYGDMAGWKIACDAGEYGSARVACAVQDDLLVALQETVVSAGRSLGAVTPAFACGWNRWRERVAPGQFFGIAESDRFVLGDVGQGGWESLRMLSAQVIPDELMALTRREHALLGRMGRPRGVLHVPGLVQHIADDDADVDFRWVTMDDGESSPALALAQLARFSGLA